MARDKIRTLAAYSIHGHTAPGTRDETPLNYSDFFKQLTLSEPRCLRTQVRDDIVAITERSERGMQVCLRFVVGNTQDSPLLYDTISATTAPIDPGENRLFVRSAWVFIFPESRIAFIEKKRPGVTISQIEQFFSSFGREELRLKDLSFSLNPVPDNNFAYAIKEMTRIREATIVMKRPNYSWTDTAGELVGSPAAESNAARVTLTCSADRGQSLSKDRGFVHDLLKVVSTPISGIKNAIVKGYSPNKTGEHSVNLTQSNLKASTSIPKSATEEEERDLLGDVANKALRTIKVGHDDELK